MEVFKIENENLVLKINRVGAEMISLKSKISQQEFLWQGDKDVWANHAPVLFPIVGGLKDNHFTYNSNDYTLPRHGFARYNENFELGQVTDSSLELILKSSEETRKVYPFDFVLKIKFTLETSEVIVSHSVENLSDTKMIFSIGGHPAFCFEESINDYHLNFSDSEKGELIVLDDSGLRTDITKKKDLSGQVVLDETSFNDDAWIIEEMNSSSVDLIGGSGVKVTMNQLDFKHFGIWSKPKAPFVCMEPWLGLADHESHNGDLKKKSHTLSIDPKEIFNAKFSFEISE